MLKRNFASRSVVTGDEMNAVTAKVNGLCDEVALEGIPASAVLETMSRVLAATARSNRMSRDSFLAAMSDYWDWADRAFGGEAEVVMGAPYGSPKQ